jgi:hypothetical protein
VSEGWLEIAAQVNNSIYMRCCHALFSARSLIDSPS